MYKCVHSTAQANDIYIQSKGEIDIMNKKSNNTSVPPRNKRRPSLTPEGRENQLISYAIDLAEEQLLDGTASSQVITHFLKLGSTQAQIEKSILRSQQNLIEAKTQAINSAQKTDELVADALAAMKKYSGNDDEQ